MRAPRTRQSWVGLITVKALGFVLLSSLGWAQEKPPAPTRPERSSEDFRRNPPAVESATLQALAKSREGGNALLEVKFARDRRLSRPVPIFLSGKETLLRDDGRNGDAKAGDGVFSAVIDQDFKELAGQIARASELQSSRTPRVIFKGREIVGVEDPEMVRARLTRLRAFRDPNLIIQGRARFDLFDLITAVDPATADPAQTLMVTHPDVVGDPGRTAAPCTGIGNPNGVWTFKHLVTEMVAGTGVNPADFVEGWLRLWDTNQTVSSGFVAAPRATMVTRVLNPWPRIAGKLDLDKSPFRLAAIVNRIDLAENLVYGGGSGGEGRFVFGVGDRAQGCNLMPFAVIFEYGVPKSGCSALKDWANQWVALGATAVGTPTYNAALEALTESFAKANAAPTKPNGSALNQLRTNENALNVLWELREFRISASSHLLFEDTVKQTADETLNNTAAITQYVNNNAATIKQDKHVVPDKFPGVAPFMAATSRASSAQLNTHFRAPGILDNDARFHFSLNTCSACHIRETHTDGTPAGNTAFLHVDPQPMPAALSRFLTGATPSITDAPDPFLVDDPVVPATLHPFNDLERRRQRLADIAGGSCLRLILVPAPSLFDRLPGIEPRGPLPSIRDPRLVFGQNDPLRMTH